MRKVILNFVICVTLLGLATPLCTSQSVASASAQETEQTLSQSDGE